MSPSPASNPVLGLLGLGRRGGKVVVGVDRVRAELQKDRIRCVVVASDASPRAREKVVRLARAKGVPMIGGPAAEAIGNQLGGSGIMVVGVADPALARGLIEAGQAVSQTEV